MPKSVILIIGLIALALSGCATSAPTSEPIILTTAVSFATPTAQSNPVEVTRTVVTAVPSPTPAVCTPLPEGMTLTIKPASENAITLELTGLQPGEKPHFIFTQEKSDDMFQMEEYDMRPVGEAGLFTHTMRLSSPFDSPDWQIKVLHARGVVCMEITLPLEETAVPANPAAIKTGAPILFARDNDLWRADRNGQNIQRLTEGNLLADWFAPNEIGDPWWMGGLPPQVHVSPDGRWLAFTQTGRNLVVIDITGTEPPRLHDLDGWASIFTWSPDSQSIAYNKTPHFLLNSDQSGIFIYDIAAGSAHRLLAQDGGNLVWSPDGRFLAFACCFDFDAGIEPSPGEIRQVELATGQETIVGETWTGVASGSPPICWDADGAVGIETANPATCSFERPYLSAISPDNQQTAVLSLRFPGDEELFRLLLVKDRASDEILWQQEIPLAQTAFWSPDGQSLLLGNNYFYGKDAAIWQIPADGGAAAKLLLPNALLLDLIVAWQ